MKWHQANPRPLPWKGKGPYETLLSEIILQQTRVEQGLPYYHRLLALFPTLEDLAQATLDEVLHAWQGLGYYSRARNLHQVARYIHNELEGAFPDSYETLIALKGIGPYTASAIASFAFNRPNAVLDGNVHRVLSRLFMPGEDFLTSKGRKYFQTLAEELLIPDKSAEFNQAIMDFGAMQCTPQSPDCMRCPLQSHCQAFQNNKVAEYPPAKRTITKRERHFQFLVPVDHSGNTWIEKRQNKDIWQHLYQFPLAETKSSIKQEEFQQLFLKQHNLMEWKTVISSKCYRHILSHQVIFAHFHILEGVELPHHESFERVKIKNLPKFAFPKVVHGFLMDYSIYLNTIHQ